MREVLAACDRDWGKHVMGGLLRQGSLMSKARSKVLGHHEVNGIDTCCCSVAQTLSQHSLVLHASACSAVPVCQRCRYS